MCKLTVIIYQCGHQFEPRGGISSAPGFLDLGVLPFSRCCEVFLRITLEKAKEECPILGRKEIHAEFDCGDCRLRKLRLGTNAKKARQEQKGLTKEKQAMRDRVDEILRRVRIRLVGSREAEWEPEVYSDVIPVLSGDKTEDDKKLDSATKPKSQSGPTAVVDAVEGVDNPASKEIEKSVKPRMINMADAEFDIQSQLMIYPQRK